MSEQPPPTTPNRRVARRRDPRPGVSVTFRPGSLGLGPDLALSLVDIHEDGLCLRLKSAVKAGTEAEVTLKSVGNRKPVKVEAEVRWCQEAKDGAFLVGLRLRKRMLHKDLSELLRGFLPV
jgi:PilZ domain